MDLLERIQEVCKEKGITVAELERESGIAQRTIYKWNQQSPSAERLQKVADYLDVSVDYLLGREGVNEDRELQSENYDSVMEQLEMLHKNPKLRVLLSSGSKLDSKGIEAVINIIDQMNKE